MALKPDLKALRLKAMGVVGEQTQATADMYNRVIKTGEDVAAARHAAERAHMDVLSEQIADLREMAQDLEGMEQATNPTLASTAAPGATVSTKPAAPTSTHSTPSAALASLVSAQPGPLDSRSWTDGDAYHGTVPKAT